MSSIAFAGQPTSLLSEVLAKLMKLNGGLSGSELADLVGLPSQTINRLLSGFVKDPRASTMMQVADYFGITIDQLLGKQPLPQELLGIEDEVLPSIVLPLFSVKEAAMPHNNAALSNDWFRWPKSTLSSGKDNFAIRVSGREFEPAFSNGTVLIIDPNLEVESEDFVLVKFQDNEAATIKKILLDQPENYFLPIRDGLNIIPCQQIAHKILGVVIEAHVDLRKK